MVIVDIKYFSLAKYLQSVAFCICVPQPVGKWLLAVATGGHKEVCDGALKTSLWLL